MNYVLKFAMFYIYFRRDGPDQVLPGHVGGPASPGDAGGRGRLRQNGPGGREAVAAGRKLHGDQRALQLLLHVGDATKDLGETPGKESGQKLRAAGKQKTCLLLGRFQHARGLFKVHYFIAKSCHGMKDKNSMLLFDKIFFC